MKEQSLEAYLGGKKILQDLVERRGRAMGEEEKERRKTWSTFGERKGKYYEIFVTTTQINILPRTITKLPLP
jgi:hypothetical protein